MSAPLVSIIIPAFNCEDFIEETIQSSINQTWQNKEIIVVDDGSTDNTLSTARKYESKGVTVITQLNKGASAARNLGFKISKGDYIQYLDGDDLLSLGKIEHQLLNIKDKYNTLSICPTVYFNNGVSPYSIGPNHEWYREGSVDCIDFLIKLYGGSLIGPTFGGMVTIHSWLTPRALIEAAGPWDERLSVDDDGEFFCRVVLEADRIIYTKESICYYRKFINRNSLSKARGAKADLSALEANLSKCNNLLKRTDDPRAKIALGRLFWENAYSFFPHNFELSFKAEQIAKKLNPSFQFKPYNKGLKKALARFLGWKNVKKIEYYKQKLK
ncbi:glycosyltransferase family 2 protein [Desertivirga brevis]|uniref:glycosyltransferase family 2 protein n=1 Tax=Desertivirga brevis TaxID=2810310 RepID=UPI001A95BA2B|nr:glycosyltransferase family 2 protein [Pedobacter sp. SYSU D00873]